jgi:hypothetical protein
VIADPFLVDACFNIFVGVFHRLATTLLKPSRRGLGELLFPWNKYQAPFNLTLCCKHFVRIFTESVKYNRGEHACLGYAGAVGGNAQG